MNKTVLIVITVCIVMSSKAYGVTELPDPTRPADYSEPLPDIIEVYELPKELIEWRVSAIRITASDRSAIVNGQLVRVGDQIDSARILEINPAAVVLDYENKHLHVRLFNNVIDKKQRKN